MRLRRRFFLNCIVAIEKAMERETNILHLYATGRTKKEVSRRPNGVRSSLFVPCVSNLESFKATQTDKQNLRLYSCSLVFTAHIINLWYMG